MGYFREDGAELVLCGQSSLSYPWHNHVSVFTPGVVLDGEIELVTDRGRGVYRENGVFALPPYRPHSIRALY